MCFKATDDAVEDSAVVAVDRVVEDVKDRRLMDRTADDDVGDQEVVERSEERITERIIKERKGSSRDVR